MNLKRKQKSVSTIKQKRDFNWQLSSKSLPNVSWNTMGIKGKKNKVQKEEKQRKIYKE